jgi:phosphatidylglycerophosphatase A
MHISSILLILIVVATIIGSIVYDIINQNYNTNLFITYIMVMFVSFILITDHECISSYSGQHINYVSKNMCGYWLWIKSVIIILIIFIYLLVRFDIFRIVKSKLVNDNEEKKDSDEEQDATKTDANEEVEKFTNF